MLNCILMSNNEEKMSSRPGSVPMSATPSLDSSVTHVQPLEKPQHVSEPFTRLERTLSPGHGESALPEDKIGEAVENLEDDWENDPENARNWSTKKKWTAVVILSSYTFVSPLASSMMAPGIPDLALKYGITNSTVVALTLSVFLLSFAIGPLILAPLSEMYGRTWILHFGNLFTIAFSLGCAFAPTTNSFIAFRFLSGFSGSAPIACGGGSVGDLFAAKDRASAMALYSLGPLIGPVIGPIAGGFIAQTIGIKYVFIVIAATCGAVSMVAIPFLRETYGPVIRMRRAAKSGDPEKAAAAHPHLQQEHGSKLHVLWVNLERPFEMLFRSSVCFILSLYMAFMYGIYYLMFATFGSLFSVTYGFKAGIGGLVYLGLGIGFFSATIFGSIFADRVYKHLGAKNGGVCTPEMRIPALFFGSFFVPVGLFTSEAALDNAYCRIRDIWVWDDDYLLYLVDSFAYAASATAAAALFRSLLGFAFPLFGQQMFDALGLGGGNSLLAGLAIALGIPFPVWLYYNGEKMRAGNPLTRDSTLVGYKN
ncbi:Efflux pump radE [Psilocybe cubensis]|uniref:Efflux pump radE n=1 Tax=Psilocybe cubensis TaxID=181762 RepID=A0ACB8GSK0_PSICU|nr:Efflux pump radE [Psilocybe cubensis]KAH9478455.1 Efflux pump radE [Psilocybe cubensis]